MKMKKIIILSLLVLVSVILNAQNGKLVGSVKDAETGEELIGATIIIMGISPSIGMITDFDGNYIVNKIPAGTYNIRCSFISYQKKIIENITIKANEDAELHVVLSSESHDLKEVVITGRTVRETENAIMTMQRKSATVVDGISSQQMSRLGDADAAGALKRVTGVSIEGGKYVYVRGLSDRYTKTTLNGAEIPGLDPNRNTVQMDLFPSNVIDNMIIKKTFSAELPGDFAGGYVNINTKDFPEKFTLNFSSSLSFNPQVHLNENFITYEGGQKDWLGMDDGTRAIPELAQSEIPNLYENNNLLDQITGAFNNNMDISTKKSFLDQSYSFSVGDQTQLFGKTLGLIASVSYQNSYKYYEDGRYGKYVLANNTLNAVVTEKEQKSEEEVIWATLLNASYKLNDKHQIGFSILHNQSGTKGTQYREGPKQEDNLNLQERTLGYLERSFTSYQLYGKHKIENWNQFSIDWRLAFTLSSQDEPDLRFFNNDFIIDGNQDTIFQISPNAYPSPSRFFRNLNEMNFDNKIHFNLPFTLGAQISNLKFGAAYLLKERNSDEQTFSILSQGLPYYGSVAEFLSNAYIGQNAKLTDANITYGSYMESSELSTQINSYMATQSVAAGYISGDLNITEKLRTVIGLRSEFSDVFVENKVETTHYKYKSGSSSQLDFLPTINLTYKSTDKMNFRAAYARTIARPVFRELAPYAAYDFKAGLRTVGNPDLIRTTVDNVDFRWEYFANPGEVISVSAFYKFFTNPIEQQDAPEANNTEIHYVNAADSKLLGVEIEIRKKLDFIGLANFQLGGNLTIVESKVEENAEFLASARLSNPEYPAERMMFGQAPYIFNSFLNYTNKDKGINGNLGFNITGEKIILITKGGTPIVLEQARPQMDFTFSKRIGEKLSLKFSAKNLLDSPYKASYSINDSEKVYREYTMGRKFGIGISYAIK